MKELIKKRFIEFIWIIGNIIMIFKYVLDKICIRCEACIDINNCPPCQTDFMRDFWIYTVIFNMLIIIGFVIKKKRQPTTSKPQPPLRS